MSTKPIIEARIKNLIQTESEWLIDDPIVLDGETVYIRFGNFVNTKVGDGNKKFSQLQYNLEKPAQPVGVLKPLDNPGPANSPRFWFAEKGVYPNVGGLEITGNAGVIIDNGASYSVANFTIDLDNYANKSDVSEYIANFKVDANTYQNPRGDSELYGNEAWYPNNDGGKNGIGGYAQMSENTFVNGLEFSAAQEDISRMVVVRLYKSSVKTANLANMVFLEEVVFPAGLFNANIDRTAKVNFKNAYQIKSGEWLFVFSLSQNMSWRFWNSQSEEAPFRQGFVYTVNNNNDPFEEQAWGFAESGFQAGLKLTYTSHDLAKKFNDIDLKIDELAGIPDTILPNRIYAIRGKTSILYYNSFILGLEPEDKGAVKVVADWNFRGTSYDDCFRFIPGGGDTTGQSLALRFYDQNKNLLGFKTAGITVVSNQGLTSNKKVVFAGNSITAPGITGKTVLDNINALGVGQITTHGTRQEGGIWQDGHSGKNIAWFVHSPDSPFTNNEGVLDIPAYLSAIGAQNLDLLNFMEMTNTVGTGSQYAVAPDFDYPEAMADLKALCTAFLNAGTKKIILQIEPSGSSKANAETPVWTKQFFLYNCQRFKRSLINNFDNGVFHQRVFIGFAGAYISRKFGYGSYFDAPNPRFSQDVKDYCTDAVHPIDDGYKSIGDGITSQILFHLQEIEGE